MEDIRDKLINSYGETLRAILTTEYDTRQMLDQYEEIISSTKYEELDFLEFFISTIKEDLINHIRHTHDPNRFITRHLSVLGDNDKEIY